MIEAKAVYFEQPGGDNTDEVLRLVKQRAEELDIKTVVLACTTGDTAVKAVDVFKGLKLIVVSHSTGLREPDTQEFTEENRKILEKKGATILTTTHAFAGVSRALRNKTNTSTIGDIIAETLRVISPGLKVGCEIAMMAADSGLVRTDEDIIAIAGTSRGSDTAIVLKPVNSHNFFSLKVREILCKPRY